MTARRKDVAADAPLTCANGEAWEGPHPLCEADVERACREFDEAVARGEYDEWGYTPAEAREREKRLQAEGRLF